jgi:ATP-dependent RNA helicase SUPV3L1/SUV3
VGKLVAGPEAMKPTGEAFVEEDAGAEVILKVQRRLQHFVDRKIAAQFEPLMAMARDEAITGLARGVAFRLVEGYGIVPRAEIADDIKALDQDARGPAAQAWRALRPVHDLHAASAEARADAVAPGAVGLGEGLDRVPDSPPPGLVTIPHDRRPEGYYTMSGYRPPGARDPHRHAGTAGRHAARAGHARRVRGDGGHAVDHRPDAGAVRRPDGRLGYKAERGERPKVKAAPGATPTPEPAATDAPETVDETLLGDAPPTGLEGADTPDPTPQEVPVEARPRHRIRRRRKRPPNTDRGTAGDADRSAGRHAARGRRGEAEPETEVFYTFTWAPKRRGGDGPQRVAPRAAAASRAAKPKGGGKPRGKGGKPGRQGPQDGPKTYPPSPTNPPRSIPTTPSRCWPHSRTSPERAAARPTGSTGGCGMRGSSRRARLRRGSSAAAACA